MVSGIDGENGEMHMCLFDAAKMKDCAILSNG